MQKKKGDVPTRITNTLGLDSENTTGLGDTGGGGAGGSSEKTIGTGSGKKGKDPKKQKRRGARPKGKKNETSRGPWKSARKLKST